MRIRAQAVAGILGVILVATTAHAATSPFGIATPDTTGAWFGGPFGSMFAWVAVHQAHFYKALTAALGSLKDDHAGLWVLFGLSFAYGVFHAVGPGHGKAVITSYLVASGGTARRGVALSFLAAGVQAVSAIVIVAIGAIVFRVSAVAMTFATDWVEIVSYGAIALFGAWLLWAKIRGDHHHHHFHPAGEACDHDHAQIGPRTGVRAPARFEASPARPPFLARASGAVLAVGIRPCSGAIIILVFALSQGIFAAGIAATLVMALGTGLTVAALATLAVAARGVALRVAGAGGSAVLVRVGRGLEIAGAACVLLLGLFLLGGALSSGLPSLG